MTVMSVTPALARAASAPACSRSVTKSLYFETTTATRNPAAACVASIVRMGPSADRKRIHQPADDDADGEEAAEHHAAELELFARGVLGEHGEDERHEEREQGHHREVAVGQHRSVIIITSSSPSRRRRRR